MLELLEMLCGLQNFLDVQHFGLGCLSWELKSSCQASVLVMPGLRFGPESEFNHNHLETISSNQNGEHIDQNLSDILGWQNAPWLRHGFVP